MSREVIKLNLIPKGEMPVFHASQFDTGRLITCELYNGEDAYNVPSGYTVELHCRKVDNNIVTMASTSIDDNVVKFTSTEQLTACNGKNLCEVAILDDGYRIGTLNFWLEVEVDPLKGGITSTSEIHDLYDQVEEITTEVIGDDYYNKTQVDDLLDAKADKSDTYTKTQVDTLLTAKADKSNTYTKAETNTLLSAKADADDVYTKGQVETKLAAKADAADVYTKGETDTLLDAKANANGVYSKVEVDAMVDDLEDAIDLKADQNTTYTKTEVDTALALKANAADVYTKAETDAKIEEAIEDILPVDTAGPSAIASFTTGLALPLVDCEAGIVATGGNGTPDNPNPISGFTEANITRCGVNLCFDAYGNKASETTYLYPSGDNLPIIVNNNLRTAYAYVGKNADVVISFADVPQRSIAYGLEGYPELGTICHALTVTALTTKSFKVNSGNYEYIAFYYCNDLGNIPSDCQIEKGNTATPYTPYNGQTYAIAFGQTVYGGVLDVTRGKLTVTHVCLDLGEQAWTYKSSGSVLAPYFYCDITGVKFEGNPATTTYHFICSDYVTVRRDISTFVDDTVCFDGSITEVTQIQIKDSNYTDAGTFTTAMSGVQLVYELATPFDIDLTPVQIRALANQTNNVFADTNGNTTVKFKDTIQNYIDKKVST